MYAVVRTGGKQYKVSPGDVIRVEKLDQELGSEMDLTEILLVGGEKTLIGEPTVSGAKVTAVVTQQARDRKVIIFKKKRRQGYRRMQGHRQHFTELFIKSISVNGNTAKADGEAKVIDRAALRAERHSSKAQEKVEAKKSAQPKAERQAAKKTAAKKKTTVRKPKAAAKKAAPKKKTTAKKA